MIGHPDPLLVAVNVYPFQLLQRLDAEALDQPRASVGVAADAEDQPQQLLLAGHGVEEPAEALVRSGDLDHRAVLPIGVGEFAEFVDALVDPVEDRPVPADRLAVGGDAVDRVPAVAVDFPRHGRFGTDALQLDVVRTWGLRGIRVVSGSYRERPRPQDREERLARVRLRDFHDVFGCALCHQSAAHWPGLGTEVDDPVGRLDHVEVVLDDDHRVADVHQSVEHFEQLVDVVEMEPGCRLVQDVKRSTRARTGQFGSELDALRLAAGERRCGLAERQVVEADVGERLQDAADLRQVREQLQRLVDAHGEHVGDGETLVADGERLEGCSAGWPLQTSPCFDPHVRQEVHLDLLLAVAPHRASAAACPARYLLKLKAARPGSRAPWLREAARKADGLRSETRRCRSPGFDWGELLDRVLLIDIGGMTLSDAVETGRMSSWAAGSRAGREMQAGGRACCRALH